MFWSGGGAGFSREKAIVLLKKARYFMGNHVVVILAGHYRMDFINCRRTCLYLCIMG